MENHLNSIISNKNMIYFNNKQNKKTKVTHTEDNHLLMDFTFISFDNVNIFKCICCLCSSSNDNNNLLPFFQ